MPVLTLLLYIVIVALLGYLATWVLGKLAPNHPAIIDNIIWVIVVLVIVVMTLQAFGLVGGGPKVPQLGMHSPVYFIPPSSVYSSRM